MPRFKFTDVKLLVGIVVLLTILDQLTKRIIVHNLSEGSIVSIIEGFFNLTLSYNRGVAFGFLSSIENTTLRVTILWTATLLACLAVAYMYIFEYKNSKTGKFGLALVLGGALGNMIDRLLLGEVVDFLDFHIASYHWPAFNIADSAICVGVCVLIFFAKQGSLTNKKSTNLISDVSSPS
jgi:signal peptidase II